MSPVLGTGVGVELVEGIGPVVAQPIRCAADVERLRTGPSRTRRVLEGCRSCAAGCGRDRRSIGFCGGPFTVAGYLVEGRPSRDFLRVKTLMYSVARRPRRDVGGERLGEALPITPCPDARLPSTSSS